MEWLTPPFKLAVTGPPMFPAVSKVNRASAALGPTPTTVPLSEVAYFPAARTNEQAFPACAVAAMLVRSVATRTITSAEGAALRFEGIFHVVLLELNSCCERTWPLDVLGWSRLRWRKMRRTERQDCPAD